MKEKKNKSNEYKMLLHSIKKRKKRKEMLFSLQKYFLLPVVLSKRIQCILMATVNIIICDLPRSNSILHSFLLASNFTSKKKTEL